MIQRNIYYRKIRDNEPAFAPTKRVCDADYDLFSSMDMVIPCGATMGISTNIAIAFPAGYEGKIEGKSGLALRKGACILGGVIDNSYIGEIIVIMTNLSQDNKIVFKPGDKIAQLNIRQVSPHFIFSESTFPLPQTERGDGGFGSTGS